MFYLVRAWHRHKFGSTDNPNVYARRPSNNAEKGELTPHYVQNVEQVLYLYGPR